MTMTPPQFSRPVVVLVHGAFGDASSWRAVFERLDGDEFSVLAPAMPLRGVSNDAVYLKAVIDQLEGPVVLVGHSYSGCAITIVGSSDKVAGLVYVAGFVPDEGESIVDLQARFPSLAMGNFVQPRPLPDGSVEVSVDPERFRDIFCADVAEPVAAFMARSQRPLVATAFEEPVSAAAWREKPSWGVFGTADQPIAPQLHRFSYDRAGSTVTEVDGASHFVMLSKPDVVARVIRQAVAECTASLVA
jgi:pimeloyl-ACP methyl ester carboxylesterase